jgi:hypothetical protein
MRIGTHKGVRVINSILFEYPASEVFEINLMADSNSGRYYLEVIEGLHAPLKKLVSRVIPLELDLQIKIECIS